VLSISVEPLPTSLESGIYLLSGNCITTATTAYITRPLKKRCRILAAGRLGAGNVSPSDKSPPRLGIEGFD